MRTGLAVFFSLYALLYGGMHLYVYFKLRGAFGRGWGLSVPFAIVSLFMIFGARALWLLDFGDAHALRAAMSYASYFWMAFIFLVFTAFLFLDVLALSLGLAGMLFSPAFPGILPSRRSRAAAALGFASAVCFYGWFEALDVRPVHVTIVTDKLPEGVERLRVAQLSDVHLGWIVGEDRLARMLAVVKDAAPDVLVVTGDLVDGDMDARDGEAALFREVLPPLGKFAVTGNHEYYAGIRQALAFKERAGIRVLRGEAVEAGGMVIAGVDDPSGKWTSSGGRSEVEVLGGIPRDRFVLLLKHRPLVDGESSGLFDLQLSGHTHGGQIWPFYWLTRLANDYRPGLRAIAPSVGGGSAHAAGAGESRIYVSNGTGTWGPPVRFFAPPEVTVIDIVRK